MRIIEDGHTAPSDPVVRGCVGKSLLPLKGKGLAALLLGCTHFGFLSEAISAYLGAEVMLISASACAAEDACGYLKKNFLTGGSGETVFITSGDRERFVSLSSRLLGYDTSPYTAHIETAEVDKEL